MGFCVFGWDWLGLVGFGCFGLCCADCARSVQVTDSIRGLSALAPLIELISP